MKKHVKKHIINVNQKKNYFVELSKNLTLGLEKSKKL